MQLAKLCMAKGLTWEPFERALLHLHLSQCCVEAIWYLGHRSGCLSGCDPKGCSIISGVVEEGGGSSTPPPEGRGGFVDPNPWGRQVGRSATGVPGAMSNGY